MCLNRCAMLLHRFTGLAEKAYVERMNPFLEFLPDMTHLEKLQRVKGYMYVMDTVKPEYAT